jgi:hypothetical protein
MHIPTLIPTQQLGLPIVIHYAIAVVVLTAVWVCLYRAKSLRFLAFAMFFPSLLAIPFLLLEGGLSSVRHFITTSLFVLPNSNHVLYSLVVVGLNLTVIIASAGIALAVGFAAPSPKTIHANQSVHSHNRMMFEGMLFHSIPFSFLVESFVCLV